MRLLFMVSLFSALTRSQSSIARGAKRVSRAITAILRLLVRHDLVKTGCLVVGTGLLGVAAGLAHALVLFGTIALETAIVIDAARGWREGESERGRPQPAAATTGRDLAGSRARSSSRARPQLWSFRASAACPTRTRGPPRESPLPYPG